MIGCRQQTPLPKTAVQHMAIATPILESNSEFLDHGIVVISTHGFLQSRRAVQVVLRPHHSRIFNRRRLHSRPSDECHNSLEETSETLLENV